ncbi:MAG TPA: hypothetical protein VFH51_09125, partial [Myxococcota bacterium]|nr:hypothetical protein [Myxococcota bacterium]
NMWPPRIDAWAEDANRTVVRVSLFGEDGDEQAVVMTDELPLLSGGPLRCPMGVGLGAKDEITGDEVLYAPLFEKALAMTHGGYDGVAAMTVAQHAKALANVGGKTVDQPDGATLKAGMEQPTVFKVRTRKQQVKGMHACDLDAHRPHPPLADDWMGYIYATNTAPLPCTLDPYVIYKDGILSAIDAVGTIMEWRPRGDKGVPAFVLYSGYNIVVPETVQAMADAFGPQDGDFQIRSMRAARDVNLVDVCQIVKHPECVPSFPPDTAYAPSPYNYLAVSGVVARFTESVTVLEAPERADAGGIA